MSLRGDRASERSDSLGNSTFNVLTGIGILISLLDTLLIAPLMEEIKFHLGGFIGGSVGGTLELLRRTILDFKFCRILKDFLGVAQ